MIFLKISKRNLNKILRMLSVGFNAHKKQADSYVLVFRVCSSREILAKVPGGEYSSEAETEGSGCFSVNYRWLKMFVKACKAKTVEMRVDHDMMTVNRSISVFVKQSRMDMNIPLSLTYSAGELVRLDRMNISDEALSFWGLHKQLAEARDEISGVLDKVSCQLAPYLPPHISKKKCREILSQELLSVPVMDTDKRQFSLSE